MFEDSLMESTGRIRTRSRYFAIGSLGLQAMLLTALALYPYLNPDSLPKQTLTKLLIAPPPPISPPSTSQPASAVTQTPVIVLDNAFMAPAHIHPLSTNANTTDAPPSTGIDEGLGESTTGVLGSGLGPIASPPPATVVKPAPPKGPLQISRGVAAGQLLAPIQPVYPTIAKITHIQGTVIVQAVISKTGTIENLHVTSGPPMLQSAAVEAIQKARYRPFLLNGEPVEVETTVNVVFRMDN